VPTLEETIPDLDPASWLASLPNLPASADLELLKSQVLAENSHATKDALRILRVQRFETPYEDGANLGEIELVLNWLGNRAIYGVYTVEPVFRCFAN
jgi:hypothetical protein